MIINRSIRSPNFNDRKGGKTPSMIVLHYTGRPSGPEALEWLCDPAREVSAHYVVEENGEIFALVDEDKRAWHAGRSYWAGETDVNSVSIGIEIVNPGHEFGLCSFPDAQISALIALCLDMMARHGIDLVLGHSDVAPGRKMDPGPLFPWAALARKGIGLWPEPATVPEKFDRTAGLHALGYNPDVAPGTLWGAFCLHYPTVEPEGILAALLNREI